MNSNELFNSLFNDYEKYREQKLNIEIIKHADVVNLVNEIGEKEIFRIEMIGCSVEGREIFSISFGTGKTKILAWSQMHGNECTATAALFDILNLFSAADIYNKFRTDLLSKTTFHFIPMLNPDGAEKYKRENAFNIDLNRDTLRLESPESEILWQYANKIQPAFAFNMHDQNSYYTAGRKNKTSAISLLAPPVDYAKSINYVREKSMQVICKVYEVLSNFIPGQIARYKDDFEPRAFGDNFTKKGISTILVESGFYKG
ncbi:MAG: M14 family zinc carboxypeptidase, partial [Bacteroidota bacterium]